VLVPGTGPACPYGAATIAFSVYSMCMARANITMPDELYGQARAAGLNISRIAQDAVRDELTRLGKVAELDTYLAELEARLGPPSESERSEARAWADEVLGGASGKRST
jgi:post-segregation antitoxin (ccd killing protein)